MRLVRRAREAARGTAAARARLAWTRPVPPGLTVCPYPGMIMVMMMMMMMMMMMIIMMTAASCGWRTHANVATDTDTALAAGDSKGGKGEII